MKIYRKILILILIIIILFYLVNYNFNYRELISNKYKISICMWYDETIKDYGDLAKKINKIYCDKHNYDLIYSNKRILPERHPAWERFPLLLNTLNTNKYDYVIWIDADACFNYESKNSIENIINSYKDKHIYFSGDLPGKFLINTGFIILKNSNISKNFCKHVINSSNRERCKKHFNKRVWEQECVIDLYSNNIDDLKNNSVIVPYKVMQIFPSIYNNLENSLVLHYAGESKETRLQEFKKLVHNL